MGTSYPGALDGDAQLPTSPDPFTADDTGHNSEHPTAHGAVRALEAKVGIGSETAASASTGEALRKQGDGTTAWAAVSYETVADNAAAVTQRPTLNFVDTGSVTWTLTDDAGNTRTNVEAVAAGGAATVTRPVYLQVVSSDAPAFLKDGADASGTNGVYLCDGTADDVQINAALAAATGEGGESRVLLSGGRFFCSNSVLLQSGVCFEGCGWNTEVRSANITADTGFGTGVALIKAALVSSHAYRITNMHLNGHGSSGGTGAGILLVSSSSSNDASGYPDTNPDPDVMIDNLLVRNFGNGSTRDGIVLSTDMRGTMISNCQMRNFSRHGVWFTASPDSHISNVHLGTVGGNGFYIQGGNVKLNNCKAYFVDDAGFRVTSGRGSLTGCESQDNHIGAVFTAEPSVCTGFVCDTFEDDGVILSTSGYSLIGCQIFQRASGRYATGARGLTISGTLNDMQVLADVTPAAITTPLSNEAGLSGGLRNFYRITVESGSLKTGG